jgi:hypothetical protein
LDDHFALEVTPVAVVSVGLQDEIPCFGMEHVLQVERHLIKRFGPVRPRDANIPPAVAKWVPSGTGEPCFLGEGLRTVLITAPHLRMSRLRLGNDCDML